MEDSPRSTSRPARAAADGRSVDAVRHVRKRLTSRPGQIVIVMEEILGLARAAARDPDSVAVLRPCAPGSGPPSGASWSTSPACRSRGFLSRARCACPRCSGQRSNVTGQSFLTRTIAFPSDPDGRSRREPALMTIDVLDVRPRPRCAPTSSLPLPTTHPRTTSSPPRLPCPTTDTAAATAPWAELWSATFGVDVEVCPGCTRRMKLLVLVRDPEGIARFLTALDLPITAPAGPGSGSSVLAKSRPPPQGRTGPPALPFPCIPKPALGVSRRTTPLLRSYAHAHATRPSFVCLTRRNRKNVATCERAAARLAGPRC